jgi:hypothetical protein
VQHADVKATHSRPHRPQTNSTACAPACCQPTAARWRGLCCLLVQAGLACVNPPSACLLVCACVHANKLTKPTNNPSTHTWHECPADFRIPPGQGANAMAKSGSAKKIIIAIATGHRCTWSWLWLWQGGRTRVAAPVGQLRQPRLTVCRRRYCARAFPERCVSAGYLRRYK